jgi:hypothetical protein
VLFLSETQIGKKTAENLAFSFGFDSSFAVSSDGRSGGLAMYWNKSMNLELIHFSQYHIDMRVLEPGKQPWRVTGIYGEANRSQRYKTW